jgi:hypothetical protein
MEQKKKPTAARCEMQGKNKYVPSDGLNISLYPPSEERLHVRVTHGSPFGRLAACRRNVTMMQWVHSDLLIHNGRSMAKALNTNMSPPAATLSARNSNISVLTNDAKTRMKLPFASMRACRSVNKPPFRPRPRDRVHHRSRRLRSRFGRPRRSRTSGDTRVTKPRHGPAPRAMLNGSTDKVGKWPSTALCFIDCRCDNRIAQRPFPGGDRHVRPQPSLAGRRVPLTAGACEIFERGMYNALIVHLTPPPTRVLATDTRLNMFLLCASRTPRFPVVPQFGNSANCRAQSTLFKNALRNRRLFQLETAR